VTPSVFEELERTPPDDAHVVHDALVFAEHAPGGDALFSVLADALPRARYFRSDPIDETYGLPPLKFPRAWFDDSLFEAHLDRLESEQQADGGWPITWQPPAEASVLAWRAIWTIEALRTLRAYGRL
jgi:hypothetical protein